MTQLHGTYRRKDRVYDENIFYGQGLPLDQVSEEVLLKDIAARKSENPLAYKSNVNENALDDAKIAAAQLKIGANKAASLKCD